MKYAYHLLLAISYWLFNTSTALAAGTFGLDETAKQGGLIGNTPPQMGIAGLAGTLIGYVLAFVGVIFFALMIYGGFLWMTSRGNDEDVKKALEIIKSSIIGIIVIFLSYVITHLVITQLKGAIGI